MYVYSDPTKRSPLNGKQEDSMPYDQQKLSVIIDGLIANIHAHDLVLKALIRKANLSEEEALDELNKPLIEETALLLQDQRARRMIVAGIKELFT